MSEANTPKNNKSFDTFYGWLSCAEFYVGYNRYGIDHGHGFLVVCDYSEDQALKNAVEELNAGDQEASYAMNYINSAAQWKAVDPCPAQAMEKVMNAVCVYYFEELNNISKNC